MDVTDMFSCIINRPINKDKKKPLPLVCVRYLNREDMLAALEGLNGKVVNGRPMRLTIAQSNFELSTSVY
jgi:RNA recognition motif-containing protein